MSTSVMISVIALVVSIASITWSAWTWLRTGPVIKVSTSNAFLAYGSQLSARHLSVNVENRGRGAATVESYGFLVPHGGKIVGMGTPLFTAPPLPHRLDSHSSVSWYMPFSDVDRICQERNIAYS